MRFFAHISFHHETGAQASRSARLPRPPSAWGQMPAASPHAVAVRCNPSWGLRPRTRHESPLRGTRTFSRNTKMLTRCSRTSNGRDRVSRTMRKPPRPAPHAPFFSTRFASLTSLPSLKSLTSPLLSRRRRASNPLAERSRGRCAKFFGLALAGGATNFSVKLRPMSAKGGWRTQKRRFVGLAKTGCSDPNFAGGPCEAREHRRNSMSTSPFFAARSANRNQERCVRQPPAIYPWSCTKSQK